MAGLKKTAIWITLLAIVLKLSGFLRESIIARQFGANEYTDGYLLAFSFITLVVAMISGGFNNVFLPQYVQGKKESPEKTERNATGILNATVLLFLLITVAGFFLVPYFVPFIFGDMTPTTENVAVDITQFFFLFMSAIALNGILESYLQGRRVFVPSQVSKLAATLFGAIFALLFSDQWGINSLAYGFIFGTLLGAVIQFFYLRKSGYRWQPTIKVEKAFRSAFLVLLVPALLNSVVGQINMFVNKMFASGTTEGAVTYLNNASLLVSIPQAIYGTTIAAIIFTLLSEQVDNHKKFQQTVFMGMQITLVTLMPIMVGLLLVGDAAISFVYERGLFTSTDTHNTYIALLWYVPLIVTQGLQYIVSKSMYARGKTAIVFRISVTTIVLNYVLNWLFVDKFGYPGLALTSSLVSVYYLAVSTFVVYKDFDREERVKLGNLVLRVILPTILMAVPIYLLKKFTPITEWYSLIQLGILVPIGVILYAGGIYLFYREGFQQLLQLVKRKKGTA
ncbi:murein biosynthesis integral membrane protein MurJ [Fredinandcohnia quinoae]|uniref:Polysaccharide biosynthesis C-terminal domain-containing protein n=1 Tax=Fredinandcohnia quinoae TaxID=2918902 RepID=A0AAW5E8M2_9BACI|nr:lipid II flippase MurJ [Fredinandcohnia sp. SECRCQ15]MCH1625119.1 polysaccharide biosynthesis C-terminal domain-containing protein [Fredinandcohnia sp. SECRCQ15]